MARNGLAHNKPYLWDNRYLRFNGILYHREIYSEHFGEIPKGYLVHHVNDNTLDNHIGNLELVTRAEHNRIHRPRLGYRAPIQIVCKVCGNPRTDNEIRSDPHRRKCNKCRGREDREKRKNNVSNV